MPTGTSLRCALCPSKRTPILGSGPRDARVMIVGEGPAREEDKRGQFFVGRSGRELDSQYLPLAGLDRSQCYVTNVTHCSLPGYRNPEPDLCASCSGKFLEAELTKVQPEVVIPLGALACQVFGIHLGSRFSVPVVASYQSWTGICWPGYHPAAALRSPGSDMAVKTQYGFERLREFLAGNLDLPVDAHPAPAYKLLRDARSVEQAWSWGAALGGPKLGLPYHVVATDTETARGRYNLWCASWSHVPGTGFVVLRSDEDAWAALSRLLSTWRGRLLGHNLAFDLDVYMRAGVSLDWHLENPRRTADTMVKAYHKQYLPQALKPLAYRLCGMDMQGFDDLVTPWSMAKLARYLEDAHARLYEVMYSPVAKRRRDKATGKLVPVTVMAADKALGREWGYLLTKLGRLLLQVQDAEAAGRGVQPADESGEDQGQGWDQDRQDRQGSHYSLNEPTDGRADTGEVWDPWKRLSTQWHDHDRDILTGLCGPWPEKSIEDVPLDLVVRYSARDSDATLRVLLAMEAARQANPLARPRVWL